jgi:hypothetical protein
MYGFYRWWMTGFKEASLSDLDQDKLNAHVDA